MELHEIKLFPGLNNSFEDSKLTKPLKALCAQAPADEKWTLDGCSFLEINSFLDMYTDARDMLWDVVDEEREGETVLIASSFGAWLVLKVLASHLGKFKNFKHVILIDPVIDARTKYEAAWAVEKWFSTTYGYWRWGSHGNKGFWMPAELINAMLHDDNNLFDGRLRYIVESGQRVTIVNTGRSYGPADVRERLAKELGVVIQEIPDVLHPQVLRHIIQTC